MFLINGMHVRSWLGSAVISAGLVVGFMAGPVAAQTRTLPDFTDLVEQVGPSVVNIRTTEKVQPRSSQVNPGEEEMMEFFRRFGLPAPNMPRPGPRQRTPQQQDEQPREQPRGVGSGFVLTSDGLIMTNAHVVEGADEVIVTLTDKREFKAKIIGSDKRSDVAVVKIEATGLPAVRVGDVARLKVGEWVMAIGSPFGLENSVTAGIVSAKQRDTGEFLPFIQTDVAINPGNSGGPLINMRGEVVGINSQIYSRSGGFMGISFSIPIDEAIRASDQLRSQGRVSRGRIGVTIDQVSKDVAESLGLGKSTGALVKAVEAGSPADKAGVEPGDVIIKFDGRVIEKSMDLPRFVGATKPGTRSAMTVFRKGAAKELQVTIAEIDPEKPEAKASAPAPAPAPKAKPSAVAQSYGLTVSELTDNQRKELKIKVGVAVDAVAEAAARAGLAEGDIILQLDSTEVASVKDVEAILAKHDKAKPLVVLYRRGDWTQYTLMRVGK
jgi:serine protease Do